MQNQNHLSGVAWGDSRNPAQMMGWERAIVAIGGAAGLCGVALAAVAAHVTGPGSLGTAASFLLAHAPVLLAMTALLRLRLIQRLTGLAGALTIAAGLLLFCGDLSLRALAGIAPVPMAAPAGGIALMAGWLLLVVAAIAPSRG